MIIRFCILDFVKSQRSFAVWNRKTIDNSDVLRYNDLGGGGYIDLQTFICW